MPRPVGPFLRVALFHFGDRRGFNLWRCWCPPSGPKRVVQATSKVWAEAYLLCKFNCKGLLPATGQVRYLACPSANCRPRPVSILRSAGHRVLRRPGCPFFGRRVDPIMRPSLIVFAPLGWHDWRPPASPIWDQQKTFCYTSSLHC